MTSKFFLSILLVLGVTVTGFANLPIADKDEGTKNELFNSEEEGPLFEECNDCDEDHESSKEEM